MVSLNPFSPTAWSKKPTAEEVGGTICTTPVPLDLCRWTEKSWRFFHYFPISAKFFTGYIEITYEHPTTGELWECHGGKYTAESNADANL